MSSMTINQGSDLNFTLRWKDEEGAPFNLNGYTVTAYDTEPTLTMSFTITDAPNGVISGSLTWNESYITTNTGLSFRVKITNGGFNTTTPKIKVYVQ